MLQNVDRHLERVIHRTIWIADLAGENYTTQNEVAVRTVRWMKPDMTASEALAKVNLVRQRSVDLVLLPHETPE
jgi:hypothetical protein